MIGQLIAHLKTRPFSRVLDRLSEHEKQCEIGLKLMTIVDYHAEEKGLYEAIQQNNPKYLFQMLQFSSYCLFAYPEYKLNRQTIIGDNYLLKCTSCEMIGPYLTILVHMAITHGQHVRIKICHYCGIVDLGTHIRNKTFQICYDNYKQRLSIDENWRQGVESLLIKTFYDLVNGIAKDLGVVIVHNKDFVGAKCSKRDKLKREHGHAFPGIFSASNGADKVVDREILDEKFNFVIQKLYNGKGIPNAFYREDEDEIITILDDSDDDGENNCAVTSTNIALPATNIVKLEIEECKSLKYSKCLQTILSTTAEVYPILSIK